MKDEVCQADLPHRANLVSFPQTLEEVRQEGWTLSPGQTVYKEVPS